MGALTALGEIPVHGRASRAAATVMARVLEGSTSGYYGWRRRRECRRSRENRRLLVEIKAIHAESDATYGSPRIHRELQARGIRGGKNRVARLMRLHQVRPKQRRRYKRATDSRHDLPTAGNHLDRQFNPEAPNGAWAADSTFVLDLGRVVVPGGGDGPVLPPDSAETSVRAGRCSPACGGSW